MLKETGQIIDLWPSPHRGLLLILNIPSSKRNGCIGKQSNPPKDRLLLSAALGTGLGKALTRPASVKRSTRLTIQVLQ